MNNIHLGIILLVMVGLLVAYCLYQMKHPSPRVEPNRRYKPHSNIPVEDVGPIEYRIYPVQINNQPLSADIYFEKVRPLYVYKDEPTSGYIACCTPFIRVVAAEVVEEINKLSPCAEVHLQVGSRTPWLWVEEGATMSDRVVFELQLLLDQGLISGFHYGETTYGDTAPNFKDDRPVIIELDLCQYQMRSREEVLNKVGSVHRHSSYWAVIDVDEKLYASLERNDLLLTNTASDEWGEEVEHVVCQGRPSPTLIAALHMLFMSDEIKGYSYPDGDRSPMTVGHMPTADEEA